MLLLVILQRQVLGHNFLLQEAAVCFLGVCSDFAPERDFNTQVQVAVLLKQGFQDMASSLLALILHKTYSFQI